jgi:hypothetical protein
MKSGHFQLVMEPTDGFEPPTFGKSVSRVQIPAPPPITPYHFNSLQIPNPKNYHHQGVTEIHLVTFSSSH